jgi:hypothetical protein
MFDASAKIRAFDIYLYSLWFLSFPTREKAMASRFSKLRASVK